MTKLFFLIILFAQISAPICPDPIRHIDINRGQDIRVVIPKIYVEDKVKFESCIMNFADKLNVNPKLILNIVQGIRLQDRQTHLVINARNNGNTLDIMLGTVTPTLETHERPLMVSGNISSTGIYRETNRINRITYSLGWNIRL